MVPDEKVVNALEVGGEIIRRFEESERCKEAQAQRVQERIPTVVEALLAQGLIEAGESKEAAAALGDHEKTLELLRRTALHVPGEGGRLGEAVPAGGAKQASTGGASSHRGGFLGRRGGADPESWNKLARAIGLGT